MLKQSKKYLQKELENLKKNDVVELQNLIKYHSDLYYNKNEPIISDFEYDNLLKKLETLEKRFNISQKQSQKV
jgi:DNA ligase (NAD+)